MRANHIMTKDVMIAVGPTTSILEAANLMLRSHISGLSVLSENGVLVGIVSQSDFLRPSEIGTQRERPAWLRFLIGSSGVAADFVHEHGRKVQDVMTCDPVTFEENAGLYELVRLMERHDVHRLPVMRDKTLIGIITRSDLLRAVASVAREVPEPIFGDDQIRDLIIGSISAMPWKPEALRVTARNGIVHLYGVVFDENSRQASVVAAENTAGVKEVHDCIYLVEAGWNDSRRM